MNSRVHKTTDAKLALYAIQINVFSGITGFMELRIFFTVKV